MHREKKVQETSTEASASVRLIIFNGYGPEMKRTFFTGVNKLVVMTSIRSQTKFVTGQFHAKQRFALDG